MQGCPYFCPYCHNPDTKSFTGGEEYSVDEVVDKIVRCKSYFGEKGGVTVSGGEPLMQAEFVAELFKRLHEKGINTALDTAGAEPNGSIKNLLGHTDYVLCDIKFPSNGQYEKYIGLKLDTVLNFIEECNKAGCEMIIRHVVVPGLTDSAESVKKIAALAQKAERLQKIELLPFKKLCVSKYEKLGIPFPLADTPECAAETVEKLKKYTS